MVKRTLRALDVAWGEAPLSQALHSLSSLPPTGHQPPAAAALDSLEAVPILNDKGWSLP